MQEPLAKFVFECVLRSTLIALSVGALLSVLRVREARARHTIWASVAVWMLAVPVMQWLVPVHVVEVPVDFSFSLEPAPLIEITPLPPTPSPKPAPPNSDPVSGAFGGLYLTGFAVLFARLVIGTVRSRRLRASATIQQGHRTSEACTVPVTMGFWRPVVILPSCWPSWPASQLDAVLAHESEHALRHDPLVQWLALFNRAVFWFHPLAWWLERKIAALAEEACDAAVLQQGHERLAYSSYLMEMARLVQKVGGRVNVAGMPMADSFLAKRIRRIVEGSPAPKLAIARRVSVTALCTLIAAAFSAGAVEVSQLKKLNFPAIASSVTAPPRTEVYAPRLKSPQKLLALAAPASPAAQSASNTGNLIGTVEDTAGARIPNCAIAVRSANGDTVASATSGAVGTFRLPNLAPGTYSVEFSQPGFARRTVVTTIMSGADSRVDALLDVGQVYSSVEVTAPGSAKNAAQIGGRLDSYPISVGGRVQATRLISQVRPVYPPAAREEGVEGKVILRAVISREGVLENVHVLNENEVDSRLAQATLDAVRQWRYAPTTLDATPVNSQTTIEVAFRLSQ